MGSNRRRKRRAATTDDNREAQLVSMAMDLAEKQMLEGTASSQIVTHYLKLGSTREKLEQERLQRENELLRSKVEMLASAQRVEELYSAALAAMRDYSGREPENDPGEEPYEDEYYVDYD